MKKLFLTLFFAAGVFLAQAQSTVIVRGKVAKSASASHKVWVQFNSYNQLCSYYDSVNTDTAGNFVKAMSISNTCSTGTFIVKLVDCYSQLVSQSATWNDSFSIDTVYMNNLKYCDPCKNFYVDFTYTTIGNTATYTNASASGTNVFLWHFGNGDSSVSSSPGTITYTSSGTYSVCLYGKNTTSGCAGSTCKTVLVNNNATISGYIILDTTHTVADTGRVWLIRADSIGADTQLVAVDSVPIKNSAYKFNNVPSGKYLIKAALIPASSHYSSYLPTYFGNSLVWNGGVYTTVTTGNILTFKNITLFAGTNPGGPGFISGLVSVGANKTGDPMAKIQVLLFTQAGQPVSYTYTDINGKYQFSNLALGSYKVRVEIPGKGSEEYLVTLTQNNASATKGDFEVNSKTIKLKTQSTSVAENSKGTLAVFPNPASGETVITFPAAISEKVDIKITDISGRVIKQLSVETSTGENSMMLDISGIQDGIYLLTVETAEKTYSARINICK